jgi:hypothetical protein
MKLGVALTNYSWSVEPSQLAGQVLDLGRRFDDAAVDTLWVADHLLQMDPNAAIDEPMLEAYTTLAYLAAVTRRVQLGTMVTSATIRPPALLVKTVTTVDVLSGGRAWLGVGAGYRDDEARMTGLPFPPTAERFSRLEEVLQIDVLARACEDIGRDPADVEITLSSRLGPGETVDQFVDRCADLSRRGVDHLVLITNGPWAGGGELDVVLDAVAPIHAIVA